MVGGHGRYLAEVRSEIIGVFGKKVIDELHRPQPIFNLLAVAVVYFFFFVIGYFLSVSNISVTWVFLLFIQGFVLQWFAYLDHELFVHRKVGGKLLSYIGSLLCMIPIGICPTAYKYAHLRHHQYTNTHLDTEQYKMDLDTRWKRLLFLTFIGHKLAVNRKFTNSYIQEENFVVYTKFSNNNSELAKKVRFESILLKLYVCCIVIASFYFTNFVLYGYVLPLLLSLPIASVLRTIIEHSDVNTENYVHAATYYRTNLFTKIIFFFDSGDCHLIHHIFPGIPFYRISKALRLLNPFFIERGIVERRSLIKLMYGYFVKNYSYRSLWPKDLVVSKSPESKNA